MSLELYTHEYKNFHKYVYYSNHDFRHTNESLIEYIKNSYYASI